MRPKNLYGEELFRFFALLRMTGSGASWCPTLTHDFVWSEEEADFLFGAFC